MLDIKFIIENKKAVKEAIKNKGIGLDLDAFLEVYAERNKLLLEIEKLKAEKNKLNDEISAVADKASLIVRGKEIKEKLLELEPKFKEVNIEFENLMAQIPNVYSPETPIGESAADNKEIAKAGKIPKFSFPIKNHIELGESLNIIDIEKGVKTSGFRGYYLKNEAVWLQMALIQHALHKMQEKGFNLMITPTIVRDFALFGSGHFPFGKDEVYELKNPGKDESGQELKEKFYLAGTSEPSLLAYFANQTLKEEELPKKVCGFSNCYRSEAGSYGKDTRGLYRMHEFMKVEQIVICRNNKEEAHKWFEDMREIAEEMLKDLQLPYRVIQICTADMGAGKYEMYDLETWMPSRHAYGETHSDSNMTDWQARRLGIKYKDKDGQVNFAYTLNNTVIASPRILIAILENYQKADGSVEIPKILRQYMPKGMDIIKPK
ncbi:MAG: serine--tRNA ligase [Candidatus Moranbacteria bacterium]|nr:serine--tRNA ligase [Candidatus Moranbacteria bacterium]